MNPMLKMSHYIWYFFWKLYFLHFSFTNKNNSTIHFLEEKSSQYINGGDVNMYGIRKRVLKNESRAYLAIKMVQCIYQYI